MTDKQILEMIEAEKRAYKQAKSWYSVRGYVGIYKHWADIACDLTTRIDHPH